MMKKTKQKEAFRLILIFCLSLHSFFYEAYFTKHLNTQKWNVFKQKLKTHNFNARCGVNVSETFIKFGTKLYENKMRLTMIIAYHHNQFYICRIAKDE